MTVIIKSLRIRSKSGISRIIRHLQNGDENEQVAFLRGTPADIRDMQRDAMARSTTYSVRHWIIAPHEATTRPQMRYVLMMLAKEFGFDADRAVVVEHRKKRATADAADVHWHLLVGEIDPATGRVLRTSFDRIIHELVSRMSEHKFGHAFVQGKHTKTVIRGLRKRNLGCIADRLQTLVGTETTVPLEAFTHAQHQEKKRLGLDLPALRLAVKTATDTAISRADLMEKLAASAMTVMVGEKPNTSIVRDDKNNLIGALHRLASKRKSEINQLLAETPAVAAEPITAPPLVPDFTSFQESETSFQWAENSSSRSELLDQLRKLEQTSLIDADIEIHRYRESSELREQRKKLRNQNAELKSLRDERWNKFEELQIAEKMRWWFYPLGIAAKRKNKANSLRRQMEISDKKINARTNSIAICESQIFRSEIAEKGAYRELVHHLTAKKRAAQKKLEIVAAAREILTSQPKISVTGIDELLEIANNHAKETNGVNGTSFVI